MIKDTKLNPLPKNIREFKKLWLKEQYLSYSDEQIEWLMKKILKDSRKFITINHTTYEV